LKQPLTDFNRGYIGAAVFALGFLSLGTLIMNRRGEQFLPNVEIFADQLMCLYTKSIWNWFCYLVAAAALTNIFGSVLTCLDDYPRVLQISTISKFPKISFAGKFEQRICWFWILIPVAGTLILISFLPNSMRFMVDFATTISYKTAPVLASLTT